MHQFATYDIDCEYPCATPEPACDFNEITLIAEPAAGWIFQEWQGDLELAEGDTQFLELDGAKGVVAVFVERPGLAQLDLVADCLGSD